MPPPFEVYRGVNQGYPLSPTIFNVVVHDVIRNWMMVVEPTEIGEDGHRDKIQELEDFFYVYDGIYTPPWTERLPRVFNVLTDIFNRVGLHKNSRKTVSMTCWPCYTPGVLSELEYTRKVTGVDSSYQD